MFDNHRLAVEAQEAELRSKFPNGFVVIQAVDNPAIRTECSLAVAAREIVLGRGRVADDTLAGVKQ